MYNVVVSGNRNLLQLPNRCVLASYLTTLMLLGCFYMLFRVFQIIFANSFWSIFVFKTFQVSMFFVSLPDIRQSVLVSFGTFRFSFGERNLSFFLSFPSNSFQKTEWSLCSMYTLFLATEFYKNCENFPEFSADDFQIVHFIVCFFVRARLSFEVRHLVWYRNSEFCFQIFY